MKIYFSGAIRGGRSNTTLYKQIIDILREYGTVLTEHVGRPDLAQGNEPLSDKEIYKRDMIWLRGMDLLIAEVSVPSLGVGYEIAKAEQYGKRVICLYHAQSTHPLSAMIAGNQKLSVFDYKMPDDIRTFLDSIQ